MAMALEIDEEIFSSLLKRFVIVSSHLRCDERFWENPFRNEVQRNRYFECIRTALNEVELFGLTRYPDNPQGVMNAMNRLFDFLSFIPNLENAYIPPRRRVGGSRKSRRRSYRRRSYRRRSDRRSRR